MRSLGLPVALFLCLVLDMGCAEPNPQQPLALEDVDLLTHALLIESVLQDFSGAQRDSLAKLYYDQLYDRFGSEARSFDDLRQRFSDDPTLWQRASDTLIARFTGGRGDIDSLLNLGVN